ncbi:MAG TPA: Uma2 family endonuclease [Amycolatopsis sp.]|nr:Uma2 family endonuclease [Amycolatopsis sp.]
MPRLVPDCVVPRHKGAWTVDQVLQLPEDSDSRVELVDGALMVSPAPSWRHQRILGNLYALRDAVPAGTEMLIGVNIRLTSRRLLIPDFVVVICPGEDFLYGTAADVLLAAEIESPSSKVTDRLRKRQLYAEANIPYYLLVNPAADPVEVVLFELAGGQYHEITRSDGGTLTLDRPFAATMDLDV